MGETTETNAFLCDKNGEIWEEYTLEKEKLSYAKASATKPAYAKASAGDARLR